MFKAQSSPGLAGDDCSKLGLKDLVCMGGFRNRRQEYAWEGVVLEVDETYFEHGTLYEIECETVSKWNAWIWRAASWYAACLNSHILA